MKCCICEELIIVEKDKSLVPRIRYFQCPKCHATYMVIGNEEEEKDYEQNSFSNGELKGSSECPT